MSLEKLKQGAEILQQVDVTEIVTSLAIGIADAQKKLDTNSIQQAIALADPSNGVGGKSLIQLGFAPAFYHFQHAEVSAEIDLKMRLKTDFELNANLYADFSKQGGYTKDKLNFLRKDRDSKKLREYKSSRSFVTSASNEEEISFDSATVKMDLTQGAINRVEKFENDLRSVSEIDRVITKLDSNSVAIEAHKDSTAIVNYTNGYIAITLPHIQNDEEAIFKATDYSLAPVSVAPADDNGKTFEIGTAKEDTFEKVKTKMEGAAPKVISFSNGKYYKKGASVANLEVFFDHDKRDAAIALNDTIEENGVSKDNTQVREALLKLAVALSKDESTSIKLVGYTDGSGKDAYNDELAQNRCDSLKNWLVANGVQNSQIASIGKGEELAKAASDESINIDFRKVTIELSGVDYFYLEGTEVRDIPTPSTGPNSFIHHAALPAPAPDYDAVFLVKGEKMTLEGLTNVGASLIGNSTWTTKLKDHFTHSVVGNTAYLLHNDSSIRYSVFSDSKDELSIRTGSNEKEDFSNEKSKYLVDEVSNSKTRIKEDLRNKQGSSTVAAGGSVNLRVARQFEMEVKGNSRVSARLVSLPAPPEFLAEIKEYYKE